MFNLRTQVYVSLLGPYYSLLSEFHIKHSPSTFKVMLFQKGKQANVGQNINPPTYDKCTYKYWIVT